MRAKAAKAIPRVARAPCPLSASPTLSGLCPERANIKNRPPVPRRPVDLKKHFLSPPYSLSVETGRNAELRCSPPLGVPPPKVYWLRNGSPLETTVAGAASASSDANPNDVSSAADGFVQSADGHLLLGEAELRHQGNYSCVAENLAARRISEPAVLTVYGKRFSPLSLSLSLSLLERAAIRS